MAHDLETKQAVRDAYVFDKLDLAAAADKHGVSRATVSRWKASAANTPEDWDKARTAASMSTSNTRVLTELVLSDFLQAFQLTMKELKDEKSGLSAVERANALSRMTDSYSKTITASAKASPELGQYSVAIEILRDLSGFIQTDFPQHQEVFLEILEPFGTFVAEKYNG
ncbi:DUF1804 family protein [Terasakiella sp. A23]|uniref:DUF1804 family protein n=1 Tax=Terasakiella sp. FCG-A23 TaxID=3080561 RepID=UPI0029544270|nr:DUF1804 family protein [Terasakiella sp. A23]MDV7340984.1 DUF1804 family protein [Terasakiella sp. A23]